MGVGASFLIHLSGVILASQGSPLHSVIFNVQLYPLPLSSILTCSALADLISAFCWPLSPGNREIMCFPHHRISRAMDVEAEHRKLLSLLSFQHLSLPPNHCLPLKPPTKKQDKDPHHSVPLTKAPGNISVGRSSGHRVWPSAGMIGPLPSARLLSHRCQPDPRFLSLEAQPSIPCVAGPQPSSQSQWGFVKVRHVTRSP